MKEGYFICCQKCGRKLIERKSNGLWHFIFGKPNKGDNFIPVEMFIQGSIKMKCFRKSCGHWQVLNYFPGVFPENPLEEGRKPE